MTPAEEVPTTNGTAEEAPAEEAPAEEAPAEEAPPSPKKVKKVHDVEWTETVAEDTRKKMAWSTAMNPEDCALGMTIECNHLCAVSRDGFHCLLNGGRATTGIKKGRYAFEIRVLEAAGAQDAQAHQWKTIRIGFGTETCTYIAGSDGNSIAMDNDGNVWHDGKGSRRATRWFVGDVICVVLNVDADSENANSFSVFRNGARIAQPTPLPKEMVGKTLFPMVALRSTAVAVNFGAPGKRPWKELPFQVRMLDDAAAVDVEKAKAVAPKNGKYSVVLPVGLPDEGTFDFLDLEWYPKQTGTFVELSDRALITQMEQSGLRGMRSNPSSFKVQDFDNGRLLSAAMSLAAAKKRNIVVMSVKKNLIKDSREDILANFTAPWFVTKAVVAVGPPPAAFSEKVRKAMLDGMAAIQQKKVDAEKEAWGRMQEMKKKKAESVQRIAKAKLDAEYRRAKAEWDKKKAAAGDDGEVEGEEPTEPEMPPIELEEEAEPDWAAKVAEAVKGNEEELKAVVFRPRCAPGALPDAKSVMPDMKADDVVRSFENFALPVEGAAPAPFDERWLADGVEATKPEGGEGFGTVEYVWAKAKDAQGFVEKYKKDRKVAEKFAGLKVGPFSKENMEKWANEKVSLRKKLTEYNMMKRKREVERKKRAAEAEAAAAKPAEEPKPEGEAAEGEAAEGEAAEKKEEEKPKAPEIDIDVDEDLEVDVWEPKEIDSIDGKGSVLYKQFTSEDWLLMQMRFELHHLVKCFAADATAADPERRGIAPALLSHYYQLYFSKVMHPPSYGMADQEKMLSYCEDTVKVQDGVLTCIDDEDVPVSRIVRVVEEARRDRVNRVAAGDESARLVFATAAPPALPAKGKGVPQAAKGVGKGVVPGPAKGKGFAPQAARPVQPYAATYAPQAGGVKRPFPAPAAPFAAKRPAYGGAAGGKYGGGKGFGR